MWTTKFLNCWKTSPWKKWLCLICGGWSFQARGAATANARSPSEFMEQWRTGLWCVCRLIANHTSCYVGYFKWIVYCLLILLTSVLYFVQFITWEQNIHITIMIARTGVFVSEYRQRWSHRDLIGETVPDPGASRGKWPLSSGEETANVQMYPLSYRLQGQVPLTFDPDFRIRLDIAEIGGSDTSVRGRLADVVQH